MDEIGKILPSLFREQLGRTEPHLLDILVPLWPRIVGNTIAQHTRPTHFASYVLTLASDSATWSTQLRRLSKEIRSQINGFLGQTLVKKLRIKTDARAPFLFSPKPSEDIGKPAPPLHGERSTRPR